MCESSLCRTESSHMASHGLRGRTRSGRISSDCFIVVPVLPLRAVVSNLRVLPHPVQPLLRQKAAGDGMRTEQRRVSRRCLTETSKVLLSSHVKRAHSAEVVVEFRLRSARPSSAPQTAVLYSIKQLKRYSGKKEMLFTSLIVLSSSTQFSENPMNQDKRGY